MCHHFFMRRYGMIIRLRPEAEAAYRQHHQAVWPAVLHTITACNIRNYTIFLRNGCLFGYYEYIGDDREQFPNQLYIHPDECIDCGACEPECPWQAIFEEPAVPEIFQDDIPLNHATTDPDRNSQFTVALFQKKEHPTAEQVAANKRKWGMDADR